MMKVMATTMEMMMSQEINWKTMMMTMISDPYVA